MNDYGFGLIKYFPKLFGSTGSGQSTERTIMREKMEKLQRKIEELEEKVSSLKGQMFNQDVENSQAFAQRVEEMDALLKNIETLKEVLALRLSEAN